MIRLMDMANSLGLGVNVIQRTLLQSKAKGEITLYWEEYSYCARILKRVEDVPDLATKLLKILDNHEACELLKVKTVAQALKLAATERWQQESPNPDTLHKL